jgi:hypothetical protein
MRIYVTYAIGGRSIQELKLIEDICKFSGNEYIICYPNQRTKTGVDYFGEYYRGGAPAIILDDGKTVVYGVWELVHYLLNKTDVLLEPYGFTFPPPKYEKI